MSLHHSILKGFSLAVIAGLALTAGGRGRGRSAPHTRVPPAVEGASSPETEIAGSKAKTESPARPAESGPCAAGMVLVEGDYCPDAEQTCLRWLDPPPYQNLRCAEYAKPAKCKGPRQHKRFCIDREEYTDPSEASAADALPVVKKNWGEAKAACEARGARLCKEAEWEFACEGPEMNPYPYGFERKPGYCNIDRTDLGGPNEKLNDHRAPLSAFPQCTSPFGVHDMTGNVDEWVEREGVQAPNRSALRGGWWLPGRNRCRAATREHDEAYQGKQVGFRCCGEAKER
ncbi:MAG: SUMF1/EgtB/PvdO family nonheme iron enzyme [Deltaproteobacteria bacterium]|nr:SUMF1/EgtB/PvdO family nonheme iron enzyme [Deltaproteobacteria bacterium]